MQLECYRKDYNLNDPERFSRIAADRAKLLRLLSLNSTDIIGLLSINRDKNILQYGFVVNAVVGEDTLAEVDIEKCSVTVPDAGWASFEGSSDDMLVTYEAIEIVQDVHCAIEQYDSDTKCRLLVQ